VGEQSLGECERGVHVQVLDHRVAEFDLARRHTLPQPGPLTLVRLDVHHAVRDEIGDPIELRRVRGSGDASISAAAATPPSAPRRAAEEGAGTSEPAVRDPQGDYAAMDCRSASVSRTQASTGLVPRPGYGSAAPIFLRYFFASWRIQPLGAC